MASRNNNISNDDEGLGTQPGPSRATDTGVANDNNSGDGQQIGTNEDSNQDGEDDNHDGTNEDGNSVRNPPMMEPITP